MVPVVHGSYDRLSEWRRNPQLGGFEKPVWKKRSLKIHPVIWREAQVAAAKQDRTVSDLVEKAVRTLTRIDYAGRIPARFQGKAERIETSIRLRSDVRKAAKVKAKERGMKLQDFVELAIAVFGLKASASPRNAN